MDDHARVIRALQEAGIPAQSVWDLVNSKGAYENAVPVLMELLPLVQDPKVKEGIVRALTVPEARKIATAPLVVEMRASRGYGSLGWAIGNALSVVVTPDDDALEELAALIRDETLGSTRQMLADALVRTKDPRAVDVLLEVLPQKDMTGHVINALGKLKAIKARPRIEQYLAHSNAWIRKEARNALKKIDKIRILPEAVNLAN